MVLAHNIIRNMASFSYLFWENYHIEPPKDAFSSLLNFVTTYSYERQGSPRAYRTIARRVLNEIFKGNIKKITQKEVDSAWILYDKIAKEDYNGLGLNVTHNSLSSDKGVLKMLAEKGERNIYNYAKILLKEGQVEKAYAFMVSISGVGQKIASLYLRDIAYIELEPAKHYHHLFQPIDTWINQAIKIILSYTSDKAPTRISDKQKLIVELCREAECSPIEFNQGAWFAGSVIAEDYGTLKYIIENREKAEELIMEKIKESEKLISSMKNWLERSRAQRLSNENEKV